MHLRKLLPVLALAAFLYLTLPLIDGIMLGVALAYISRPAYDKLKTSAGKTFTAAALMTIIVLLTIVITLFTVSSISTEVRNLAQVDFFQTQVVRDAQVFLDENPVLLSYVNAAIQNIDSAISNKLTNIINELYTYLVAASGIFFTMFMAIITGFYALRDYDKIENGVKKLAGRGDKKFNRVVHNIVQRVDGILYFMFVGSGITAIIVGVVVTLTLWLMNIPYAALIGILSAIIQFLPLIGPPVVLLPIVVFFWATGSLANAAIMLAVTIILSTVPDTYLKPKIISYKTTLHPFFVIIAFLGGTLLFGLRGFVLGPIITALFVAIA